MLLSLLCNVLFICFACNEHSLFMLLTSFAFLSIKKIKLRKSIFTYLFHVFKFCYTDSTCPNTQKPLTALAETLKFTKFTVIGEAVNSTKKPLLIQSWTVNCHDGIVCPMLNDNWLVYVFKSCCVMVKFFCNFVTGKIVLDLFQNNVPLDSLRLKWVCQWFKQIFNVSGDCR